MCDAQTPLLDTPVHKHCGRGVTDGTETGMALRWGGLKRGGGEMFHDREEISRAVAGCTRRCVTCRGYLQQLCLRSTPKTSPGVSIVSLQRRLFRGSAFDAIPRAFPETVGLPRSGAVPPPSLPRAACRRALPATAWMCFARRCGMRLNRRVNLHVYFVTGGIQRTTTDGGKRSMRNRS